MTSKTASGESIAFRVLRLPAAGRERSAKYAVTGQMEYQDNQLDLVDSEIYIIRLLSREQHNALLSNR